MWIYDDYDDVVFNQRAWILITFPEKNTALDKDFLMNKYGPIVDRNSVIWDIGEDGIYHVVAYKE